MSIEMRSLADVDLLIHEPSRLLILATLASVENADFLFLSRETGLTRGNLSVHLSKLEKAGYVHIMKTYRGKIPLTVCHLTDEGRVAFMEYRRKLISFVDRTTPTSDLSG